MLGGLGAARAQSSGLQDAPAPHHFFDRTSGITFSAHAAAVVMDSVSTQRFMAYGNVQNIDGSKGVREMNPIAKHFFGTTRRAGIHERRGI
jgi:hypothetical protein